MIQQIYHTKPAWALIGICAGLVAALQLVPENDFYVPGKLTAAAAVLALGLLLGPVVAGLKSFSAALRTEHLLMLGLVYWILLDPIQGSYGLSELPRYAVLETLFSVAWFAAFLWLGSIITDLGMRGRQFVPGTRTEISARSLFIVGVALFAIGSIRYLAPCNYDLGCIYDLFFQRRGGTRWILRFIFGDWGSLINALRFCGYLVLPMAVALHHVERRISWRVVVLTVLGLFFLLLLVREGGRRGVGTVVLASALLWVMLHGRVKMRQIATLVLVTFALLGLLQVMLAWRYIGIGTGLTEDRPIEVTDREGYVAVDRNFYYMGQLIAIIPERHPYAKGDGLLYLASLPIPRAAWPGKPINKGFDLPAALGKSAIGFSITNSAVGDLYIIRGYLAIAIGGLIYGFLARLCSQLLRRPPTVQNRLIFALGTLTLFVSLRALSEVIITGYALLFAVLALGTRSVILRMARVPGTAPLGQGPSAPLKR